MNNVLEIEKDDDYWDNIYNGLTEYPCYGCGCNHPIDHFTKNHIISRLKNNQKSAGCKEYMKKIDIKKRVVGLSEEMKIGVTLDNKQMDALDIIEKSLGIIYFVSDNYKVKIGVSRNVFTFVGNRWHGLQGSSPNKLNILGVIQTADYKSIEKELHEKYSKYHSHGEWFYLVDEIKEYISQNCFSLTIPNRYFGETHVTTPLVLSDDLGY